MRASALVLAISASTAPLAAQGPFRSGIDLVTFDVGVVDKRGELVTNLAADDFEILEDGRPQVLRTFARGDQVEALPPLHLGLLFDTSESMGEDIEFARSGAVRFLNTLTDAVDITLVDFDTEVRAARYGQADFPRLVERIRMRKPRGMTALYDALGVYLDGADGQDGRKVLVVYTDGGDTRSAMSSGEVMTLLRASDVTVYVIGFMAHQSSGARDQKARLERMAAVTGGRAFFPSQMKDLEEMYGKVVAEIRGQFSLGYVSSNPRADGTWRKVEIRLARTRAEASGAIRSESPATPGGLLNAAGIKEARIRARAGYFAPLKDPDPAGAPQRSASPRDH